MLLRFSQNYPNKHGCHTSDAMKDNMKYGVYKNHKNFIIEIK